MLGKDRIREVKVFRGNNPLYAAKIPYPLGSPDYSRYDDGLREAHESPAFSSWVHEHADFQGKRVLDGGSGNGFVLSKYATAGATVMGVDITAAVSSLSRARFDILGRLRPFERRWGWYLSIRGAKP